MAIKLYTTSSCTYCVKAKNWLRTNHIPFTEYNIERDPRRADEMVRKSGQSGVPVIDVQGKIVVGFNQQAIERALRR